MSNHSNLVGANNLSDIRVNAVSLNNVAKYWVLTNLLPGPVPQVSIYGLGGATSRDQESTVSLNIFIIGV